jgi:hypothetical protein
VCKIYHSCSNYNPKSVKEEIIEFEGFETPDEENSKKQESCYIVQKSEDFYLHIYLLKRKKISVY